ncbi:MAG: putative bicarbonate transporter, IctB family [Ilumatobacteraceae bacterium]|nr:putative bicarbonate transporter, IctB family [Ilumatobacteraceae bacterium]
MGDRLTLLLPRVGFGALVVAAFLVPIVCVPPLADAFVLPKAFVSWVAVLLAVVGVVAGSLSLRQAPFGRLRILLPLGLLVAWTALATVMSPQPLVSLLGGYGRYDGLAALLTGAGAALAVVACTAGDPGRLARLAVALVAGGAVGLLVVVLQWLGWAFGGWRVPGLASLDVVGLGGNPNFTGALLALVIPFALGLRSSTSRREVRIGAPVLAVALAGGVAMTGTRGGFIAVAGGVAAFAWVAPELLPKAVRWGATVVLVAALGAVAVSSASDVLPSTTRGDDQSVLDTSGLGQREYVWAGAARSVVAHPVVGVGPDALALAFPYERPPRGGRPLIDADEAHDVYLDRAATAGLPALACYLWLVGTVAVVAWRGRRRVAAEHRWLLAAFAGGFAAYLLQGALSIDMVPLAFCSWLFVGALVSLTDPAVRPAGRAASAAASRPLPLPVLTGLVLVVVVGTAAAIRPVMADRHVRLGSAALAAGEPLEAYGEYAAASSWLGHEPSYHQRQSAALVAAAAAPSTDPALRETLLDEAIIASGQALDRAPGDLLTLMALADSHVLAAEAASSTDDADAHLAEALAILEDLEVDVRADDVLHLRLGRLHETRARLGSGDAERDQARAAEQYELARRYRVDELAALEGLARLAIGDDRLTDARRYLVRAQKIAPDDEDLEAAADEVDRRIRDEH